MDSVVGVEHSLAYRVIRELKRLGFDCSIQHDSNCTDNNNEMK